MNKQEVVFKEFLKTRGLRFTPERNIILKMIISFNDHFDVELLYDKIKQSNTLLSRATVYRAIPLFLDSGLIKESLRCSGRINYDDHLICIKCGAIIEFKDDKIEEYQDNVCKKYNFKPIDHKLGIRGYCSKCQKE